MAGFQVSINGRFWVSPEVAQRRRARMLTAEGSYSVEQWNALVASYDRCPMCLRAWADIPAPSHGGDVITVDHIVAISKRGSNYIDNIQPPCYSCNSIKGDR